MIDRRQIYQDFQAAFPKERLVKMTLTQYTNLERQNSFCYWVESKTYDLGSIWGGSSYKFGIYEYRNKPNKNDSRIVSNDKYAWYNKYDKQTADEAFAIVRSTIFKIAEHAGKGELEAIEKIDELGDAYKWKIAFLYSDETLIPVYKRDMLVKLASYFGMSVTNKTKISDLQRFLIEQKGEKDLFEFYEELLNIVNELDSSNMEHKIWLYAPGENASKWDVCLSQNIMCIGWDDMGNLLEYSSKKEMATKLQDIYGKPGSSFKNDSLALWEFAYEMQVGDIVIVKKGQNQIIGRGIVKSDYTFDDSFSDFKHVRKMQWTNVGEWETVGKNVQKTLTDITKQPDSVKSLEKLFENKSQKQYWWLVASPKIWSFSKTPVGEIQDYTLYNDSGNQRRVFQNFIDAKEGDVVIGYEATPVKQVVAIAEIAKSADGQKIYFKKIESLLNPVDYSVIKDIPGLSGMEFLKNKNGSFFKLTKDEYNILMKLIRGGNPMHDPQYSETIFLDNVFIKSDEYNKLRNLLLAKKNVILQGAPGVGKTYSARRLAYSIIGEEDRTKIEFIQFHQNYSYEDFVMGYKPKEDGGFELRRGVFYNFCRKAQSDPDKKYFFIIDEINRGNMSKIFGELLMLIEKDYRGEKHQIRLAYNDEYFFVPENLYIIGMMNTADRSLAMIDYALRRRFSFFDMVPGFDSDGFKKYQENLDCDAFNRVIDAIKALNVEIAKDDSLGKGFCIGHSYFCNQESIDDMWLGNVIEYDIAPMLREYWFDNDKKFKEETDKLLSLIK